MNLHWSADTAEPEAARGEEGVEPTVPRTKIAFII